MEKNKLQRSWRSGYRVSGRFSYLMVWRRVITAKYRENKISFVSYKMVWITIQYKVQREEQIVCTLQDGCGE